MQLTIALQNLPIFWLYSLKISKVLPSNSCLLSSCCCIFNSQKVLWKRHRIVAIGSYCMLICCYNIAKTAFCRMGELKGRLLIYENYSFTFTDRIFSVRGIEPKGHATNQTESAVIRVVQIQVCSTLWIETKLINRRKNTEMMNWKKHSQIEKKALARFLFKRIGLAKVVEMMC